MSRIRGSRRSSGRKHRGARRRFVAGLTLFALALVAAIVFAGRQPRQPVVASDADLPKATDAGDLPTVPAAETKGAVYPYSIIAGGARSVDELKQAIAGDPVVAAHYAGFDLEKTHAVRLEQPKLAHVSYRIGSAVYWTRSPLTIRAGETVLTDGVRFARTRCGNQLAETPGEISPAEPSPAVLDTPIPFIVAAVPAGMLPLSALQNPGDAGGISLPALGSPMSGMLLGGGGSMSESLPSAAGAVGTGLEADQPANQVPVFDDSIPYFPVPPGGSLPPFGGPPSTPDPPKWLVPPETLFPPGDDLPPGLLDPDDPETPSGPDVPPVPEPGTAVLMLGGAAAYAARRLKSKAASDSRQRLATSD